MKPAQNASKVNDRLDELAVSDPPPSPEAMEAARNVLGDLARLGNPLPVIESMPDGGINAHWEIKFGREVVIILKPSGEIVADIRKLVS